MKQEEEELCCYLGIDYRDIRKRYEKDAIIKPLLDMCITQTKRVIRLEKMMVGFRDETRT